MVAAISGYIFDHPDVRGFNVIICGPRFRLNLSFHDMFRPSSVP